MDPLNSDDLRLALRDLKDDLNVRFSEQAARTKEGFDGVHSRLDELNGRTRKNESDLAVLQASCTVRHGGGVATSATGIGGLVSAIGSGGWKVIGTVLLLVAGSASALINLISKLVEELLAKR
jgi:hypothetical protein